MPRLRRPLAARSPTPARYRALTMGDERSPGSGCAVLADATLDDVGIPACARLRDPALGRIIDVVEPESARVPLGPLEVVQQGPAEVAADIDALRNRVL